MESDSDNALVVRTGEAGHTVYMFEYTDGAIQTEPVFEWSQGEIKFVALKREESWGMVVTDLGISFNSTFNETIFFQFDAREIDYSKAVGEENNLEVEVYTENNPVKFEFNYE